MSDGMGANDSMHKQQRCAAVAPNDFIDELYSDVTRARVLAARGIIYIFAEGIRIIESSSLMKLVQTQGAEEAKPGGRGRKRTEITREVFTARGAVNGKRADLFVFSFSLPPFFTFRNGSPHRLAMEAACKRTHKRSTLMKT